MQLQTRANNTVDTPYQHHQAGFEVTVQRNTRTDLTSRPRLQAGRELKRLSDGLTSVETAGQAVRWGEALNAWHERWKDFIAERTYARDDPSNPKASRRRWWWTQDRKSVV